jgi:hypothetical protein
MHGHTVRSRLARGGALLMFLGALTLVVMQAQTGCLDAVEPTAKPAATADRAGDGPPPTAAPNAAPTAKAEPAPEDPAPEDPAPGASTAAPSVAAAPPKPTAPKLAPAPNAVPTFLPSTKAGPMPPLFTDPPKSGPPAQSQ